MRIALSLTACLALAACVSEAEPTSTAVDEIEVEPVAKCAEASAPSAHRAAIRLKRADGGFLCSGVLFTAQRIATAAHCVKGVAQVIAEIDEHDYLALVLWAVGPSDEDVAVLELSSPLASAAPAPLATHSAEPIEPLTIVGYGCSGGRAQMERPTHRRWSERAQITEYLGAGCACPGDSGSPVFNAAGELVAVNWASGRPGLIDASLLLN
jgi:V8-like Glu-specific endopeptidase